MGQLQSKIKKAEQKVRSGRKREWDTHLDGHEEYFGDKDHHGDVIGRVLQSLALQQTLQDREKHLN